MPTAEDFLHRMNDAARRGDALGASMASVDAMFARIFEAQPSPPRSVTCPCCQGRGRFESTGRDCDPCEGTGEIEVPEPVEVEP